MAVRSSSVGWSMGAGRFGQARSPLLIGLMPALSWPAERILFVMAAAQLFWQRNSATVAIPQTSLTLLHDFSQEASSD